MSNPDHANFPIKMKVERGRRDDYPDDYDGPRETVLTLNGPDYKHPDETDDPNTHTIGDEGRKVIDEHINENRLSVWVGTDQLTDEEWVFDGDDEIMLGGRY
ncbi:MAG: hypothetical protein ABEN55_00265, partial [Bradymonadaceae bacterium]